MILAVVFTGRMKGWSRIGFVLVVSAMGLVALRNSALPAVQEPWRHRHVTDRIAGSVNRSFFEVLTDYPMGNGLGGAGTSIPYFLEGQVRNPIALENEYAMILGEQGIIGLLLWIGFLCWFVARSRAAFSPGSWMTGRRIAWSLVIFGFGTAWIGVGMLTSIPGTTVLLLAMGWTSRPRVDQLYADPTGRRIPREQPYVLAHSR